MKWLICFLSFYILVLSNIPCNAGDDCCGDEITIPAGSNSNADDKHNSPCAPFLACGNYHGVTIPDNFTAFLTAITQGTKLIYFYKEAPLSYYSTSIWQPPKTV